MKKIIFIVSALTMLLSFSKASEHNGPLIHVSGQVMDSLTSIPLPFATVTAMGTTIYAVTIDDGSFNIYVPSDTCTIVATYMGYKIRYIKLNPQLAKKNLIIRLSKEAIAIEEIRVVTEKEKIIRTSSTIVSAVQISPKLIAKLPNLGEVDVMRSFQLLPGISGTNESSSGLYVRGGTPDQNLILFDGMTIYHVDHFFGFFSAFNSNTIDDIQLTKGGFSADYGGRISSVMDITGKPADLKNFHAGGGISLLSANAYVEVPVIKDLLSFQIAARRSYSDIIQTGLYDKIFNMYDQTSSSTNIGNGGGGGGGYGRRSFQQQTVVPTFHFYDINSKLTYKPTSKDEIFISFYNGDDKLDQSQSLSSGFTRNAATGNLADITNWGNLGASAQWKRQWNNNFTSHIFISYSDYFNTTDRQFSATTLAISDQSQNENIQNTIKDATFRFKNEWKITNNQRVDFGTEITHNNINYSGQRTDTLIVNGSANLYAWYVTDNIDLVKKIHINIGYRGDYFQGTSKYYNEPRFSLIYNISDALSFKTAVGKYYQFVSCVTQEDILLGNKEYWLLDNSTNVPVSSAIHYIAGLNYDKNGYVFSVEGYYKDLTNVLEESQRATRNFLTPTTSYNIYAGTGVAKGIEFMAQKKLGNTTGWICYTLGSVIYNFPDLNYGQSFYAEQDQTHEIKVVASQTYKKFDFSATFVYATGKPYTAPESLYQLTMLNGATTTYYHLDAKDGVRLPPYSRVDIAATYNWGDKLKKHLSASIFNLLNHQNIWYKEFNPQGYQLNVTNVSYLGFTPNISFSMDF